MACDSKQLPWQIMCTVKKWVIKDTFGKNPATALMWCCWVGSAMSIRRAFTYRQAVELFNISGVTKSTFCCQQMRSIFKYRQTNVMPGSSCRNGHILLIYQLAEFRVELFWTWSERRRLEISIIQQLHLLNGRHTAGKPRMTEGFRRFIRCRHYAWINGETDHCRRL